ncbi:hypothetical protein [Corynebacterium uterequi]|uniref:Uncharacterized protein n=1 Tax=Corynebacterium uterequi TaxID=1072256 RepID=A0A0G3HI03_9CORY|nr:hypothetical protein [Corynebacterium uterequi]AKK11553.1 hypothetical protein CUTER_07830 [Corynebacterium uterequi]
MTVSLVHAPAYRWDHAVAPTASAEPATLAVLTINGMPRSLRTRVEQSMVICLRSEPLSAAPGTDVFAADWFTRWSVDHGCLQRGRIRCRQVISATPAEIDSLRRTLASLATNYGFDADVSAMN